MLRDLFLRDHPDLIELKPTNKNFKTLVWAEKEKYISLPIYGSKIYYTKPILDEAKMWKEKLL